MKHEVFKRGLLGVFSIGLILILSGIAHAKYWAQTYGGTDYDWARSIQQTSDGGYIVAGMTVSFSSAGSSDVWVLKLGANGNIEWQKTYGGSYWDEAYSIQQTSDGGYIVAGKTYSFDVEYSDFWVLKLDANGNVKWQKTYGGSKDDWANSIQQTSDGGYIVAGYTDSFGAGGKDFWVLKLDANGNVEWQKTYGGSKDDLANSIQQTSDGGYIVAGGTESFGANYNDVWVLKLDGSGNIEWQKTYGGSGRDLAYSIQQTSDGGYIVAGYTDSSGAGGYDVWVLKLDGSGNIEWQKAYGGTYGDLANSIQQTSDGGYIVAGDTYSFGAGESDFWVLKLDGSGNVKWQKAYGGTYGDLANSIQQTSDGGYIVAGRTKSFGADYSDVWVLKLNANGEIPDCVPMGTSNATVQNTTVTGSDTTISGTNSSGTVNTSSATPNDTNVQPAQQCLAYDLSITKAGTGSGTVTSNPAGIDCGNDCTESYSSGTVVTLTATPDTNSTFSGWSGDCTDIGNNQAQVTMDADKTCTATFNAVASNAKNGTSGGGCSFTPYKSNPTMLILIIILLSVLFIRRARLL